MEMKENVSFRGCLNSCLFLCDSCADCLASCYGIIVGGYLPFLLMDQGSKVTVQAVLISMLSVAGSEAVLLIVIGIPLILVMEKTGLKNKLP